MEFNNNSLEPSKHVQRKTYWNTAKCLFMYFMQFVKEQVKIYLGGNMLVIGA